MKNGKWIVGGLVIISAVFVGYKVINQNDEMLKTGVTEPIKVEKPYEKYSFARLVERVDQPSEIGIGRELSKQEEYTSNVFYYRSDGRRISGQINIPTRSHLEGIVVMARGYVEKDIYKTGLGTRNAAAVYAKNGYIAVAPDFSGYGESDKEDEYALGARLVKPVEILDLIASVQVKYDLPIYLWGHSNGGQIMLSVGEVLGRRKDLGLMINDLPAQAGLRIMGMTLWAPVSKPFPYNILYYTDEAEDQGKWLRSEVARFEADYDVFDYSIDRYLDWIDIPIQLHQGSADDAVPIEWSEELIAKLEELEMATEYYRYSGVDHNLQPGWDSVVSRDLEFFASLAEL